MFDARPLLGCLTCLITLLLPPMASAELNADEIVITEIMYDPASDERWPAKTEWVEIYNRSDQPIDIQGWYLANERGQTQPIHDALTLDPGQAAVLIPGNQTVENFRAAWGEGFPVVPLAGWHQPGLHQLTNEPDDKAGVLTLRRTAGDVADEVNYDNEGRWPNNKPDGASIYLLPHAVDTTANDDGANWARSQADEHGAKPALSEGGYDQRDVGSPGVVVIARGDAAKDDE